VPEQDPIPPRRHARHNRPGDDDDVPPWANLPPVRPGRPGAPSRLDGPRHPDVPRHSDAPRHPNAPRHSDGQRYPEAPQYPNGPQYPEAPQAPPRRDEPRYPDPGPRQDGTRYPGSPGPGNPGPGNPQRPTGPMRHGGPTPPAGYRPASAQSGPGLSADPMGRAADWSPEPDDDDNYPGWTAARRPDPEDDEPRLGRAGQRAARLLLRRRRRTFLMAGAVVVVIAAILATVLINRGGGQTANISTGLVNSFQPGELSQVPNACAVVPQATVQQYLPGKVKVGSPQNPYGALGSQCFWTVDSPPVYRLLDLNLLACKYSGLASGDGSATNSAIDQYDAQLQSIQHPAKKTSAVNEPTTTVTVLNNIGNQAFGVLQVYKSGGNTTTVATVEIRFHNVLVTAEMNGLDGVTKKGDYGPVTASELQAAALAFAQSALASLH
jgi:hypothetical protein